MARINIEEHAWKRIYRLAEIVGCSVREAAGTVACLWGNSQDLVKTHGSKQDIMEWSSLFNLDDEIIEIWIGGLEKARFISLEKNDVFHIRGNEIQIENLISKTTRASKGGKALKKKLQEMRKLQASLKQAKGTPEVDSKGLKSNQIKSDQLNSVQVSSKQIKTNQEITPNAQKPKQTSELNAAIWAAYKTEYHNRYTLDPVRNASVNSKISQLAKRLGQDAIEVVKFFIWHPDSFYLKNTHAIGLCLRDAESLHVQWRKGKAITITDIRNYERKESYSQILRDIDEGKI